MRWLLALATVFAFWRRSCAFRHHTPVRHPMGFYRCSRCGRAEEYVGAFLGLDEDLEHVNPERLPFNRERRA